jgi:hypothetical protein
MPDDELERKFRRLVQAKLDALNGELSNTPELADPVLEDIDRQLKEIGDAWGLDAEELADSEHVVAAELSPSATAPGAEVGIGAGAGSSARPSRWKGLTYGLFLTLWGASFGLMMWGQYYLLERHVMIPEARAHCQAIGYEFRSLEREGRVYVGASCQRTDEHGRWESTVVRHGYLVENLTVDKILRVVLHVVGLIIAVALPSVFFFYLLKVFTRKRDG